MHIKNTHMYICGSRIIRMLPNVRAEADSAETYALKISNYRRPDPLNNVMAALRGENCKSQHFLPRTRPESSETEALPLWCFLHKCLTSCCWGHGGAQVWDLRDAGQP